MIKMPRLGAVTAIAVILGFCSSATVAQQPARPPAQAPAAAPAPQPGARLPPAVIAVVDLQVIMRETTAAKGIRDQIEKQRQTYQGEISKRENELRAAEQELGRQRTLLSADAFAERRRGFETQVGEFQKQVNARKRQLDQAFQDSMKQVETVTAEILAQIAGERGINLVLPKQGTFLSANELDITKDVQQRVERKIQRVTVKLPPLQN